MKINLLILLIYFVGIFISKAQTNQSFSSEQLNYFPQRSIIDSLDTVVIDISQSTLLFNCLSIPIYILSDDPVNALDINFKYNQNTMQYDSISNLTSYIQVFSSYNAVDSTVRITSNSLQVYTNDTPLITLNISMLGSSISHSDFYMVNCYLNGDPCVFKIIDQMGVAVMEYPDKLKPAIYYPNPVKDILHIDAKTGSEVRIFDLNGRDVIPSFISSETNNIINTEGLTKGVYILKIFNDKSFSSSRIFIE